MSAGGTFVRRGHVSTKGGPKSAAEHHRRKIVRRHRRTGVRGGQQSAAEHSTPALGGSKSAGGRTLVRRRTVVRHGQQSAADNEQTGVRRGQLSAADSWRTKEGGGRKLFKFCGRPLWMPPKGDNLQTRGRELKFVSLSYKNRLISACSMVSTLVEQFL